MKSDFSQKKINCSKTIKISGEIDGINEESWDLRSKDAEKSDEIEMKARLLEEAYKNIAIISEIGQKITSSLDIEKVLNTIYENVNSLMDASLFGIGLYREQTQMVEYKMIIENSKRLPYNELSIDENDSMGAQCIRSKKVIISNDLSKQVQILFGTTDNSEINIPMSLIYCPLIIEERAIGFISIQSYKKNAYSVHDLDKLKALASYVAIALNNSEKSDQLKQTVEQLGIANSKLEKLSNLDGLTEIPNRRCFNDVMGVEWERMKREKLPISTILIDIDCFKKYNDNYGHLSGDEVIKRIAKTISGVLLRPGDFVARYGGEEFIVILPNTDVTGVFDVAMRIREAIEGMGITHAFTNAPVNTVTASFGTSTAYPQQSITIEKFMENADRALYTSKIKGKNCVTQWETEFKNI